MNTETKRHIDAARQVLVGVVPNPTSQIDQITYALIYKFMDDMDQAAIKNGDEPAFFIGNLEQYSWARIMDSRIGNQDRMNLYVVAFQKFAEAKQLPELFRNILKSAFLPYRSPETLGLFLKEIDYFDYSHPEELGNAYEYLLSIMSSQGDAGQFRTPRHIIDFIVDVVNPTKDDKVLDPACGTGGFLVSSYRHILENNKKVETQNLVSLTPDQRKKLMNNFEGYDIDPTMVRIAQVNMYLHQFKNPKIFQYDTLSSDERWNDKSDVILANPPFMSPKGGIKPHSKFSIQSTRSEVLFVDYIINHLKPKGRAGIIVPEGIIFKNDKGYKQLRKNLVEDGLFAVVSLHNSLFKGSKTGVKTSILLFDNEIAKQKTEILFIKIENDGYALGSTRRALCDDNGNKPEWCPKHSDMPVVKEILSKWKAGEKIENKLAVYAEKSKIAKNGNYNLSGDLYRVATDYSNAKWPMVKFDEVVSTITPPVKILKKDFKIVGSFPVIDQSQEEISGWTDNQNALVKSKKPLVIFGDHTCVVKYTDKSFAQGADGIKILLTNDQLLPKFFYYILKIKPVESEGYKRHFAKLKRYQIPLPPLEIQEQIVAELDGYQNIITGAKQIIQNWKPKIDIPARPAGGDPEWEKVKLGEVCSFEYGGAMPEKNRIAGDFPVVGSNGIVGTHKEYLVKGPTIVVGRKGSAGEVNWIEKNCFPIDTTYFVKVKNKVDLELKYLYFVLLDLDLQSLRGGGAVPGLNRNDAYQKEIPLPPLATQKQIVEKIEAERTLVESAKKLIEIYEQKTKKVIAKLWEE